jgi:hypothetical protein
MAHVDSSVALLSAADMADAEEAAERYLASGSGASAVAAVAAEGEPSLSARAAVAAKEQPSAAQSGAGAGLRPSPVSAAAAAPSVPGVGKRPQPPSQILPTAAAAATALAVTGEVVHLQVAEQRVSPLLQSLFVAVCLGITPAIQTIPTGVLWGYFAFMAVESLPGSQLWERLLLLLTDSKRRGKVLQQEHAAYLQVGGGGAMPQEVSILVCSQLGYTSFDCLAVSELFLRKLSVQVFGDLVRLIGLWFLGA